MIGIVVAAHGELAKALVATAKNVFPHEGAVEPVGITEQDDAAGYEARLREVVERTSQPDGVLVLTDMFGGTPSNVGLTLHEPGRVEVLTGANLPMLIKAMQLAGRGAQLEDISSQVKDYGKRAIAVASQVLGIAGETKPEGGRA